MKSKIFKFLCTTMISLTMLSTFTGCEALDKFFEPTQVDYESTIYNDINKKDEYFNNYDNNSDEEKDEDKENKDNQDENNEVTTTPEPTPEQSNGYQLSYEEVVEYKITDLTVPGYSITFNLPAELYDLKKMNYDTPDNLIDIRDAHWHGTYYAYAGNETAHFRVLANMFNQKDMEDSWNNITNLDDIVFMSENIFKDLQQNDDYVGIERQAPVVLTINGNEVTYVVYNYTNDKGLESAIIMAGARMGDRYFYTEYRIDGLFKDFNYEELIVNIYQSAVITENSGNDIVTE